MSVTYESNGRGARVAWVGNRMYRISAGEESWIVEEIENEQVLRSEIDADLDAAMGILARWQQAHKLHYDLHIKSPLLRFLDRVLGLKPGHF